MKFTEVKDKILLKATPMEIEKLTFLDNSYNGTGPRAIWTRYEAIGPHLNRRELKNEDLYSMVRMIKKNTY